jgi:hypothetical protein
MQRRSLLAENSSLARRVGGEVPGVQMAGESPHFDLELAKSCSVLQSIR